VVFDVISLLDSAQRGDQEAYNLNLAALALDLTCAIIPGATGGGPAYRTARATVEMVEQAAKAPRIVQGTTKTIQTVNMVKGNANCFTAETVVSTKEGLKPIEEIAVGDYVLAKDESTGEMGYKEVVNKIEGEADELVHLTIGEEEISCTPLHPFYVLNKGWVIAEALQENDVVVSAEGEKIFVNKIWIEKLKKKVKIFNLTVADWHTYFVTESKIWVHNTKSKMGETKGNHKKLSDSELKKRLKTDDIHGPKKDILKDNQEALNKTNCKNPDIGVDKNGNVVLIDRSTGKSVVETDVPLDSYSVVDE
jgi:nicotinamide mononucleotide adenylyltransferase